MPGAFAWVAPAAAAVHAVLIEHLRRGGVGRTLVETAAELIGSPDTGAAPALVLAAGDLDGVHLLVHGPVPVRLVGVRDRHETLSTSIGDPIIRTFTALRSLTVDATAGGVDPAEPAEPFTELRDGVVPATGVIATWGEPVDAPGRRPIPAVAARRLSLLGGSPRRRQTVPGLLCSRQHFNDPAAHFCAHCGIAMHQASFILVNRPRPPLGILVFDTGEAFELDDDLSIGRMPIDDSLVTSGLARALTPSGDVSGLSRVHASIHLDGWNVGLRDRGSLNGTFVWNRDGARWTRIAPDETAPISAGDTVGFGCRTATFATSIRTA